MEEESLNRLFRAIYQCDMDSPEDPTRSNMLLHAYWHTDEYKKLSYEEGIESVRLAEIDMAAAHTRLGEMWNQYITDGTTFDPTPFGLVPGVPIYDKYGSMWQVVE